MDNLYFVTYISVFLLRGKNFFILYFPVVYRDLTVE